VVPLWLQWAGALVVVVLSVKPVYNLISSRLKRAEKEPPKPPQTGTAQPEMMPVSSSDCGPT
jgi:hypothetical protein